MRAQIGEPLTPNDDRLMTFLAAQLPTNEIAVHMSYDRSTVNRHIRAIQIKLGVKDRVAAMHAWTMLQPRYIVKPRRSRCRRIVGVRDASGMKMYAQCDGFEPCDAENHEPEERVA